MSDMLFSDDLSDEELEALLNGIDNSASTVPVTANVKTPPTQKIEDIPQAHESANLYDDGDDWIQKLLAEDDDTISQKKPQVQNVQQLNKSSSDSISKPISNRPIESAAAPLNVDNKPIDDNMELLGEFSFDDFELEADTDTEDKLHVITEPVVTPIISTTPAELKKEVANAAIADDDFFFDDELGIDALDMPASVNTVAHCEKKVDSNVNNNNELQIDGLDIDNWLVDGVADQKNTTELTSEKPDEMLFDDYIDDNQFSELVDSNNSNTNDVFDENLDTLLLKAATAVDQPVKNDTDNARQIDSFEAEFVDAATPTDVNVNNVNKDSKKYTAEAHKEDYEDTQNVDGIDGLIGDNVAHVHNAVVDEPLDIVDVLNSADADRLLQNDLNTEVEVVQQVATEKTAAKTAIPSHVIPAVVAAVATVETVTANKPIESSQPIYLVNSPLSQQKAEGITTQLNQLKVQINELSQKFFNITNDASEMMKKTRELQSECADDFLVTYEQMNELKKTISQVRQELSYIPNMVDIVDEALETDLYTAQTRGRM